MSDPDRLKLLVALRGGREYADYLAAASARLAATGVHRALVATPHDLADYALARLGESLGLGPPPPRTRPRGRPKKVDPR